MKSILVFGDSNTHGTMPMADIDDQRRHPPGTRWPSAMFAALGGSYHVIEEGQPGRTTVHDDPTTGAHRNGARVLLALLESHRPLDLVIIMLGTNDLKGIFNAQPIDIAGGITRLVRIINGSGSGPDKAAPQVMIVAPPNVIEVGIFAQMYPGAAEKSARLAAALEATAQRLGAHFFDANTVASVDPHEGIHFDAQTHQALGAAMAPAVQRALG